MALRSTSEWPAPTACQQPTTVTTAVSARVPARVPARSFERSAPVIACLRNRMAVVRVLALLHPPSSYRGTQEL